MKEWLQSLGKNPAITILLLAKMEARSNPPSPLSPAAVCCANGSNWYSSGPLWFWLMGEHSGGDKSSISNDLSVAKVSTLLVLSESLTVLVCACFFFPFVCFHTFECNGGGGGGGGGGGCCWFFQKINWIVDQETQISLISLIKKWCKFSNYSQDDFKSSSCNSTLPLCNMVLVT